MPSKKTSTKKTSKNKPKEKDTLAKIKDEIKYVSEELLGLVDTAKKHYDKVDDKTKKKVVAGIIGAAALVAGAIGAKKMMKKK
jgi:hypothetical protein